MKLILLTPAQQSRFRVSPGTPYAPTEVPDGLAAELLAMGVAQRPDDFPVDPRTGAPRRRETAASQGAPQTAAAEESPGRGRGRRG